MPSSRRPSESPDLEDALGVEAAKSVRTWAHLNTREVVVDRRLYGRSGAQVVAAFVKDVGGGPERKVIIKALNTRASHDNESRRHRAALADAPGFAERHIVAPAYDSIPFGDQGFVMFQRFAAGGLREHVPVRDFIESEDLAPVVSGICHSVLTDWNGAGAGPAGSWLLSNLLVTRLGHRIGPGGSIREWAAPVPQLLDAPEPWLRIAGEVLPNPLAFALSPRLSGSVELRVHSGRVHGDLHLDNVLASAPADGHALDYWLIDLASYEPEKPLAWDQASMLLSVIRQYVVSITDTAEQERFAQYLVNDESAEGVPGWLRDAVVQIRAVGDRWAEALGLLPEWTLQFQVALVSTAVIHAGRSSLSRDDRWWFFRFSARLLGKLLERLGVAGRTTTFDIDDPVVAALSTQRATAAPPRRRLPTGQTPPGLPAPVKAWKQRQLFRINVGTLRKAPSEDSFYEQVRAYLLIAFGGLSGDVHARHDDDIPGLVLLEHTWEGRRVRAAVQAAFLLRDVDRYETYAARAVERIRAFQRSDHRVDHYLFLHSQDHRDQHYNQAVFDALSSLLSLGDVGWTGLWDCVDLVLHTWAGVHRKCVAVLRDYTERAANDVGATIAPDAVSNVPFARYGMRFSPHGVEESEDRIEETADPVAHLIDQPQGLHLVIGEFGYGKTTVAIRASRNSMRETLFLPAARLTADVQNFIDVMRVVLSDYDTPAHLPALASELWRDISARCLEWMLSQPHDDLCVIVDGLDEAPMAHRRYGVVTLFQALRGIRVPVVVSVRTEFWNSRRDEVRTALPLANENSQARHGTVTELLPWDADSIVRLIDATIRRDGADDRLAELRGLVLNGDYEALYGDIPRRPLFLAMLVDDVRAQGNSYRSRVGLMVSWLKCKTTRDWHNPFVVGSAKRPPISALGEESADLTNTRAHQVMTVAARKMISWGPDGTLSLLPRVAIDDVLSDGHAWFSTVNPEALAVQSVLLPTRERLLGSVPLFRFAHQSFQEFFLALSLSRVPDAVIERALPVEVRHWLDEIRSDPLWLT